MEVKHSPLPWRYQEAADKYTHIIRGGETRKRFICQLPQGSSGEDEANARLIVQAVNSHARLVECLREAREVIKSEHERQSAPNDAIEEQALQARLAIWDRIDALLKETGNE